MSLDHALYCISRGWRVFPSISKRPLVKWSRESTLDPDMAREWWAHWPNADVCIKTGADSDLVVVDWDLYKTDDAKFPLGPTPATYTAITPKGGLHFYFTHPGTLVRNSAGAVAPFVDIRGDGGMVVAYPHPILRDLLPFPEEWNITREYTPLPSAPVSTYDGEGDGLNLAVSILDGLAKRVISAPDGELNTTLYQCTADASKMAAAGELSWQAVETLMLHAARIAGHPSVGASNTIKSAMAKGMAEPTSCVDLIRRITWKM